MDISIFDYLSIDITDLIGRYVSDYHQQKVNFRKVNSELIDNKLWVQIIMDRPLELLRRMGTDIPIHPARIILKDPTIGWDILSEMRDPSIYSKPEMKDKLNKAYMCVNNKRPMRIGGHLTVFEGEENKKFNIDLLCNNTTLVINDLKYRTIHIKPGDFRSPGFTKNVDIVAVANMTENDMIIKYKKKFSKYKFNQVKNIIECQPRKGLRGWPSDEQTNEKKRLLWNGLME
jgi:hypothetical protein